MTVEKQIEGHIASLPEAKGNDMRVLHELIFKAMPETKLWFDEGKDNAGKTVTNPTIGYGSFTIKYAGGKTREFFQVGISANATGISVYIMGLEDKTYLPKTFGDSIGKAKVTGYCIRFNKLKDINTDILELAIKQGVAITASK